MKKLIFLTSCLLFAVASQATDIWNNNLRYSINSDGISATVAKRTDSKRSFGSDQRINPAERVLTDTSSNSGSSSEDSGVQPLSGDLEIPESISSEGKTYSVTSIAKDAFWREEIVSVVIPRTVTMIDEAAFMGCEKLTKVILPEALTTIKPQTFSMTGLTSVTIPQGVSSIEWGAFSDCNDLLSVTLSETVARIDLNAFGSCRNLKEIHVRRATPPTLGSNVFDRVDKSTCVVYVPKNSKSIYEKVIDWAEFKNIREE